MALTPYHFKLVSLLSSCKILELVVKALNELIDFPERGLCNSSLTIHPLINHSFQLLLVIVLSLVCQTKLIQHPIMYFVRQEDNDDDLTS